MTPYCPDIKVTDPRPEVDAKVQENEGKFQLFMMLAALVSPIPASKVVMTGGNPAALRAALQDLGFTQTFTDTLTDPVLRDLLSNPGIVEGVKQLQIWTATNMRGSLYGGGDPCRIAQFVSFLKMARALEDAGRAYVLHINPEPDVHI